MLQFPLGCSLVFFCLLWLKDLHDDRTHEVTVNASTPVFDGKGDDGGCSGRKLTVVQEGTTLPLRRIRYLKDCATVDVILPNGRQGYFVPGEGNISIEPLLATY